MKSALYYVMHQAAEKAGRALIRDFNEVEQLQVSVKGPADFVSHADRKAEKIIIDMLNKARPEFGILAEESGSTDEFDPKRPCWIIDPLDGTTNFLHGLGHFAISIALSEGKKLIAGMVYDPLRGECFFAEHKKGAYLNGTRIRPSMRNRPESALFATGIPFKGRNDNKAKFLRVLEKFIDQTAGVRRYGAASLDLAYVACGRYDGFWEQGLQVWDVAAGILLVREAGGTISDFAGNSIHHWQPQKLLADNVHLHEFMCRQLSG